MRIQAGCIFRKAQGLTVLEYWRALLNEGGHAFFLVLKRKSGVERSPLEWQSFGERRLVGSLT
jgi:hypothetical protein